LGVYRYTTTSPERTRPHRGGDVKPWQVHRHTAARKPPQTPDREVPDSSNGIDWTKGPGRAKWDDFTTLHTHLIKFMGPAKANRVTAAWFHAVKGYWPGADLNRVAHGKPPKGKIVGPG
jgi:hypothetical protein